MTNDMCGIESMSRLQRSEEDLGALSWGVAPGCYISRLWRSGSINFHALRL